MVRVGLVSEGKMDYPVLERVVHTFAEELGISVETVRIWPEMDATSGAYGPGGWSHVLAWCLRNSGLKLNSWFVPLLDGDLHLDFIVVHLDGDTLDLVRPHCEILLPASSCSIEDRVSALSSVILSWLTPAEGMGDRVMPAVPVIETECWLACADDETLVANPDWEMQAQKATLRARHIGSFSTAEAMYLGLAEVLADRIAHVEAHSRSLRAFGDTFRSRAAEV